MKKLKLSSIGIAWLARAKSAVAPARAHGAHERLDLVLPRGWPESAGAVAWCWRRGDERESGQISDLSQLPPTVRGARACVWTPAADTMLTRVTLPTRARRKIMQALPYTLEDRLLGDPDSLHFAYRNETDGGLSVAVTDTQRLRVWLEVLKQAGIQPAELCPATLLAPWALDCWSLVFAADEVLVRTGGASGFVAPLSLRPGSGQAQTMTAMDGGRSGLLPSRGITPSLEGRSAKNAGAVFLSPPPLLISALEEAARSQKTPESLVVFNAPAEFPLADWSTALKTAVRVEKAPMWDWPRDPHGALNLLQGEFEPRGQINHSLRPYLPAAAMLLIWLLGNIAFDLGDWWKLRRQHQEHTREMSALLLSTFPETKTILDPAAQMQRSIEALLARTGHRDRDLLPLLAKTAAALRTDARVRLRGVRYADQSLTLELSWPAPGSPDAIKAAFEAAGVRAEVLGLTPRAAEVDGRLRLQPLAVKPVKPGAPS